MIQDYLDLLSPEHRNQPKLTAWLTAALSPLNDTQTCLAGVAPAYDLDTAVGAQLDALGIVLGVSRVLNFQPTSGSSTLDDTNYRLVLRAKILANQWDGTREQYEKMVDEIMAGCHVVLADNEDMTMDVAFIDKTAGGLTGELLEHGYLLPAPSGVKANFEVPLYATWDWYYYQYTWDQLANHTWDELETGI